METSQRLHIGIFEEDSVILAHLHEHLSLAGYTITACIKEKETFEASLESLIVELFQQSDSPPYDLLIIDIPSDLIVGRQVLVRLAYIGSLNQLPMIILVDMNSVDQGSIQANLPYATILSSHPIQLLELLQIIATRTGAPPSYSSTFFEDMQRIQRNHFQRMQQMEHGWVERRQNWLNQRKEWIEQRQIWLEQSQTWINKQRLSSHPQLEWLEQQEAWIQQQYQEVKQQRMWVQQLQLWINRYRNRINQQEHPPFSEAQ